MVRIFCLKVSFISFRILFLVRLYYSATEILQHRLLPLSCFD
ncbi:hypothetical protein N499_0900 [Wolbachia pipientis wVitA]|nr:hypothetical protein N499_0900 [Wolbachia pipientis wVitA]